MLPKTCKINGKDVMCSRRAGCAASPLKYRCSTFTGTEKRLPSAHSTFFCRDPLAKHRPAPPRQHAGELLAKMPGLRRGLALGDFLHDRAHVGVAREIQVNAAPADLGPGLDR